MLRYFKVTQNCFHVKRYWIDWSEKRTGKSLFLSQNLHVDMFLLISHQFDKTGTYHKILDENPRWVWVNTEVPISLVGAILSFKCFKYEGKQWNTVRQKTRKPFDFCQLKIGSCEKNNCSSGVFRIWPVVQWDQHLWLWMTTIRPEICSYAQQIECGPGKPTLQCKIHIRGWLIRWKKKQRRSFQQQVLQGDLLVTSRGALAPQPLLLRVQSAAPDPERKKRGPRDLWKYLLFLNFNLDFNWHIGTPSSNHQNGIPNIFNIGYYLPKIEHFFFRDEVANVWPRISKFPSVQSFQNYLYVSDSKWYKWLTSQNDWPLKLGCSGIPKSHPKLCGTRTSTPVTQTIPINPKDRHGLWPCSPLKLPINWDGYPLFSLSLWNCK